MSPGRALILVENLSVPFDRRVWQECRALREAGYEVSVVCPQGTSQDREPYALIDGVEIHRYPLTAATGGWTGYLREYPAAIWRSWRLARRLGRFDVVHICNPPDLLFLVALPLKLRGARVIFDQHDLVPELYESRFGRGKDLLYRGVVALERLTYRVADVVIATNEQLPATPRSSEAARHPERVFVVRSAPDLEPLRGRRPRPGAQAGQGAPALLPRRHGPAGRRRLRAQVARRAARHAAATTGTPRSSARATASTRCARSRAGSGLTTTSTFTGRIPDDELLALPLDRGRRAVAGPAQPAQRRLDDEQDPRVHGRRPADRLVRPARGARLGRRRRPLRRLQRHRRVRRRHLRPPRRSRRARSGGGGSGRAGSPARSAGSTRRCSCSPATSGRSTTRPSPRRRS